MISTNVTALFMTVVLMNPAPPDKPTPKDDKPTTVTPLPVGPTNWGDMEETNGDFTLENHPQWEAIATRNVRKDGSVYWHVQWTLSATGRPAPGIYELLPSGVLVGQWGYSDNVKLEPDGRITGQTSTDKIHRIEKAK